MSPEEFAREFGPEFTSASPATSVDPHPYGQPTQPAKTGLTTRGKAVLAIGGAVLAGGGLLTWQHSSTQAEIAQAKAAEITLQQQRIELEKLKEINKANATAQEKQASENSEQSKQIAACVKVNQKLVGKMLGITYQSVRDDCQDKFTTTSSADMQAAASASDTASSASDGGINTVLLIGGVVLAGGIFTAARRSTAGNPE